MKRERYDDYVRCFNGRDYDGVFDFYDENPEIRFFGIEINTREQLKEFYGFLHSYVKETVQVLSYAATDEFVALEGIVRVEGLRDLTREALDEQGLNQFFPIKKGDVQEMKQYIHYHLRNGKIRSVGCAIPLS